MKFTRDGVIWTVLFIAGICAFLVGQFDIVTKAFPHVDPAWSFRLQLVGALGGFVGGFLKMSPLALDPSHPSAGVANPSTTVNMITNDPTTPTTTKGV